MEANNNHNEIAVTYNLPDNWEQDKEFSFDHLSDVVTQLHDSAYSATVKAINRFATVRNYVIGFYIVEYEQHGSDRAKYGDRLLKRLAEKVNKRGINETLLQSCRRFYTLYPQIQFYLEGKSPTALDESSSISPTASEEFMLKSSTLSNKIEISSTPSNKFITPADKLIFHLSFSHLREIIPIDDPLARFFYETECIKCCWSVKELRRQISTNLYFRAGISKKPELLLQQTEINTTPVLSIKDPFSFEFLDLRPEAFTENDLENALITHLQEFLLEMGKGFCFEARQKRIIIDDEYYFADLVFYNRILHCNVIIELKDDEFTHADLSQLNAYVSYFRENEMNAGDNPPVGILLCTRKGEKMVEYALAGMDNNLFVSTYMLSLPDKKTLKDFLLRETNQ
ncbi:MAG: PDDEXK nuclease domain-containing protein [Bacteroidales bacterium]|nr:PDDEXK nuclease domain-containing protein [Bacteroidales bacterium]